MRFSPLAGATCPVACLLAAFAGEGFAQPESALEPSGSAARRLSSFLESRNLAEQRRAAIENEIAANGPYSAALIDELNSLAFLYREIGENDLAVQSLEQALQIVRANSGLFSLDQIPLFEQLLDAELARGNGAAVQALERRLIELAYRHPTDLRSADILQNAGDRQLEVYGLYLDGALPPEVTISVDFAGMGTRRPPPRGRSSVFRAQRYYLDAIGVLLRSGPIGHDELRELETKLLHTYYLELTEAEPDPFRIDILAKLGKQAHERLISYATWNGTLEDRARALVGLADWELLFSRNGTALERYREAYAMLADAGGHDALLAELFAPDRPVALPAFAPGRFDPPPASDARYVELTFDISKYGKSRAIHVTDMSGDAADDAARAMMRWIARSRFRPMFADGEPARASSIVVRYGF